MIEPFKIKEMFDRVADQNNKFRIFLKKNADADELDSHFMRIHNEIFSEYDCCKCNNCCKLYDIRIEQADISAICSFLEWTESDFIDTYLIKDKDEDCYIIKDKPCNFLDFDGKCRIYKCRPLVCRDFPYTNKPYRLYHMIGLLNFSEECPVIFEIIERLKQIYNFK